jgi:putative endonuclease
MRTYYVYIMASRRNGTLYIGVTNDWRGRAFEHREGSGRGFTTRYGVKLLVHFEVTDDIRAAIQGGEESEEMAASLGDRADRTKQS